MNLDLYRLWVLIVFGSLAAVFLLMRYDCQEDPHEEESLFGPDGSPARRWRADAGEVIR